MEKAPNCITELLMMPVTIPSPIHQEPSPKTKGVGEQAQSSEEPTKEDPGPNRKSGRVIRPPNWISDFYMD